MLKKPDDDLFRDSTMTFGEHLEELRTALFRSILWLIAGCGVGMWYGDSVVQYINEPLEAALKTYYQDQAIKVVEDDFGSITEEQRAAIRERAMIFESVYIEPQRVMEALKSTYPKEIGDLALPKFYLSEIDIEDPARLARTLVDGEGVAGRIWASLSEETRTRIKRGLDAGELSPSDARRIADELNKTLDRKDLYSDEAFEGVTPSTETKTLLARRDNLSRDEQRELNWRLLHDAYPRIIGEPQPTLVPLMLWRLVKNDDRLKPKSLGVQEPFMLWLKAGFLSGFVLASPFIFYHLWMFVAAGLYPHEKRYVHIFLPFSIFLFVGGVCLALFYVFEPVLGYLFRFNASLGIDPDPRIGEWLSFFLILPLGFGVAFQLPLVMLFLERIGILTVHSYLAKWKIAVMTIVILACVLTPADPVSFLFLGIPLLFLYFGGIGLCWAWPRRGRVQMA